MNSKLRASSTTLFNSSTAICLSSQSRLSANTCVLSGCKHEKKVEQSAKKRERKRQAEDNEGEEKRRKGNDGAAVVPVEQIC